MSQTDVIIIGAGLAGLSAAVQAKAKGKSVLVLEKSSRAGGVIRSTEKDGFLLEHGPNTVPMNTALWDLIKHLSLQEDLETADSKTPRYIYYKNEFHPVPLSPAQLVTSSLLSTSGKLKIAWEPRVEIRKTSGPESLDALVRRRLGPQVADRLLAPFVGGIWAADPKTLSASAAFPKLIEWERTYGSLIKGAMNSKRPPGEPRGLISFRGGLEKLIRAMGKHLGQSIKLNTPVTGIDRGGPWTVRTNQGNFEASKIILALPAAEAAALLAQINVPLSQELKKIRYVPLAVVHLGYQISQIGRQLSGFGFLTDPSESPAILGCVFNSQLFIHRSPQGTELLTVFIGGDRRPDLVEKSEHELAALAERELKRILKINGASIYQSVTRHARAIPHYSLAHDEILRKIREGEEKFPGLKLIGNYRGGISVGDVVKEAGNAV